MALVVGNASYRNVTTLDNPVNDAKLMADTLHSLGFTLIGGGAQLDLDKGGLDEAVQSFGNQIQGADVAMFYYAGHGVQVNGSNYLVPINANATREADVDFQMLNVASVLRQMEASGTRLNLVILDACRNNPFGARGLRSTSRGLAQIQAPEGTLISYATQPGDVASDGADGNSPFTKALAQTIRRPGLDIFHTFNEVGLAVKRSTGGVQQPWVSSSPIDGNFYFVAPLGSVGASTSILVEPKSPASSGGLQAGGVFTEQDMQRVNAIATKEKLAMPQFAIDKPDSNLSATLRKFIGVWASEIGFGGGVGRHAMLIVTAVDARARATGYFVWGPPTAAGWYQNPAGHTNFDGKIANDQLTFEKHGKEGWQMTVRFVGSDRLLMVQRRSDGKVPTVTVNPVWRLVEAELSAKR